MRNAFLGAVTLVMVVVSMSPVADASSKVPFASGVNIKMVAPSSLASNGSYEVNVSEANPSSSNCSFQLSRYTDQSGGFVPLGTYPGTATNDLVSPSFGKTQYQIVPVDCSGNTGSTVTSVLFTPTVIDAPTQNHEIFLSCCNGSTNTVSSSAYYDGTAYEVYHAVKWRVFILFSGSPAYYNIGIVIGTGPKGGLANVYLGSSSTKLGTINFYSPHIGGKLVAFKYGVASAANDNVLLVQMTPDPTGHGHIYGWFDALTINECPSGTSC